MWLRRLQADRVRNLRGVDVELSAGLTLVTGRNGHGKTSLLEAAYLLGTGHSFRTRRLDDVVAREGGPMRAAGRVGRLEGEFEVSVVYDADRHLVVDGAELDLDRFLGRVDLVAVTGEISRTLRDGPEARRRFLDSGIVGLRPGFLRILGEYRRILESRNALLRKGSGRSRTTLPAELDAWDARLAEAASRVHFERRRYATELASRLGPIERVLFPEGGDLGLRYRPSPPAVADTEPASFSGAYAETLAAARERDIAWGFTGDGPHRDDLRVDLDGADLRRFGSSGQVRAAMVALGVGKLALLRDERREAPLFLMDDFDSDLDDGRTEALVDHLHGGGFQAILASSKEGAADRLTVPFQRIRIEGGIARSEAR